MQNLTKIKRDAMGEIQLTDAIAQGIDQSRDVYGYQFSGQRFDRGSKAGFLQATVSFGLEREDLHDEFSEFLTRLKVTQSTARALKLGA
jgi:UTP--glucose-1-phosphate uridylyltransferase